ncbi:MAG: hypothetical protein ACREJQ_06455, partial [bacterium]
MKGGILLFYCDDSDCSGVLKRKTIGLAGNSVSCGYNSVGGLITTGTSTGIRNSPFSGWNNAGTFNRYDLWDAFGVLEDQSAGGSLSPFQLFANMQVGASHLTQSPTDTNLYPDLGRLAQGGFRLRFQMFPPGGKMPPGGGRGGEIIQIIRMPREPEKPIKQPPLIGPGGTWVNPSIGNLPPMTGPQRLPPELQPFPDPTPVPPEFKIPGMGSGGWPFDPGFSPPIKPGQPGFNPTQPIPFNPPDISWLRDFVKAHIPPNMPWLKDMLGTRQTLDDSGPGPQVWPSLPQGGPAGIGGSAPGGGTPGSGDGYTMYAQGFSDVLPPIKSGLSAIGNFFNSVRQVVAPFTGAVSAVVGFVGRVIGIG